MAFYRAGPAMQEYLVGLIDRFADQGRPGLHEQIAVNWVRYDPANVSMLDCIHTSRSLVLNGPGAEAPDFA